MLDSERIQSLADIVEFLLQQIDLFMQTMTEEDFDLLDRTKKELENKISKNMSALPIIIACGGNYNSMEDMIYPVYSISMLGRVMVKSYDEEYTKQLNIEQMKELKQDLKELENVLKQKSNYQLVNNSLLFVNGKSSVIG